MSRKNGWLLSLVVLAMLVAACGPQMATPTASTQASAESSPTAAPTTAAVKPEQSTSETEGAQPSASGEWATNADDWRVLGSPDALVTIVDYSDFQ